MSGHRAAQDRITYCFAPDGVLAVEEGQDVLLDGPGGSAQDAVAWLMGHQSFGEWFTLRESQGVASPAP